MTSEPVQRSSTSRTTRMEGLLTGDSTSIQYVEFDGQGMVPSLIQKVDDTYYFGYDAKQPKKDEKVYRNFKMKLESTDERERAEAEKLTLLFFCFLYEAYEEQKVHFGTVQNEKTLISYPAKWTERTRRFMVFCAEQAGFPGCAGGWTNQRLQCTV